jgi:hypothetical protein
VPDPCARPLEACRTIQKSIVRDCGRSGDVSWGRAIVRLSWLLVRPPQNRSGTRSAQDLKSSDSSSRSPHASDCWPTDPRGHRELGTSRRVGDPVCNPPVPLVAGLLEDIVRSRPELLAESALLRQQLIVAARHVKRPAFRPHERGLLVLLARLVRAWPQAFLLVRPETLLRWHREGFRLLWRWRSRHRQGREPRVCVSTIALIRRMAEENRLWGAERIRGELLKLGIRVAKRTVQRYMRVGDLRLRVAGNAGPRSCATTRFGPATSCRPTTSASVRFSHSSSST